jgi:hypothetical protein
MYEGTGSTSYPASSTKPVNAGTYSVTATVAASTDGNWTLANGTAMFSISKAAACVTYNGDLFVNGTSSVNMLLSAVVADNSGLTTTDARTASVTFRVSKISSSGAFTFWANYDGVLDPAHSTATTAIFTNNNFYTETLGTSSSNLSFSYKVDLLVGGNYTPTSSCSDQDPILTASYPTTDFVTGGGFVIPMNTTSNGANAGVKNNFGFNMKYNSKMTNLQGNFNSIIRKGDKVYQFKSNNPNSLTVAGTTTKTASLYYGSVVIQQIDDYGNVLWSQGANTAVIQVIDNGEPGASSAQTPDQIQIVIRDKNGVIWYTNIPPAYVNNNPAYLQNLGGGNIQVRTSTTTKQRVENTIVDQVVTAPLIVKAFPNPTSSQFFVNIQSSNSVDPIQLRVFDLYGRTLESRQQVPAGSSVQLGETYKAGIYFIEVMQGDKKQQLKLIKQ